MMYKSPNMPSTGGDKKNNLKGLIVLKCSKFLLIYNRFVCIICVLLLFLQIINSSIFNKSKFNLISFCKLQKFSSIVHVIYYI